MKNHLILSIIFTLVGVVMVGLRTENANANFGEKFQAYKQSANNQQAVETPIPTDSPSVAVVETPESRVLPPIGSNAGLVIGASVLVLIIIVGVGLSSMRKPKH